MNIFDDPNKIDYSKYDLNESRDSAYIEGPDGCVYESFEDVLQTGFLGMCGCGDPGTNVDFVAKALQLLKNRDSQTYEESKKVFKKLFKNDTIEYFVWYTFDLLKLTEHGGSVPGWLTDKGEAFLKAYEIYVRERKINVDSQGN